MDQMEVDDAFKCGKPKYKSINLKLLKESNNQNQNWLVIQKSGKNTFTTVPKRAPKPKPSLKVSLPIIHYLKVMHQFKNSNVRMKTPSPTQIETPQQIGQPPRTPLRLSPSSLRKFRHPVPTSKGRTTLADKLDQIIKTPEPISKKTNLKCNPTMPHSNINTLPIEEPVKQKAEELKTSESKYNTNMLYKMNNEEPISVKHKLPLTLVAPKLSYGNKSNNPVNKENLRSTNNTLTTFVQATQTEKVFIVTEEGYQILETIKKSGLTYQDLQNQIVNFRKQMDTNNDNDCVVIDLESTEENDQSNDVLDTVMKHSNNNKNVLNATAQLWNLINPNNDQPSAPAAVPPPERMASTSDQQPYLAGPVPLATSETPSLSCSSIPYADMVGSFRALATLQKLGFRLTNSALEPTQIHKLGFRLTNNALDPPQTHMLPRTDTQATQTGTQTGTQTEDENNNSKRRKNSHAQRVPVLMTQQQELPMFHPQMQPRQLPQMQGQQFVPEHVEQSAQLLPTNLPGLIPHQRNQFTMPRNHNQYQYEHNTSSALRTPQIQVQMPSPVQLQSPALLHPNDPRNRIIRRVMSRVLSTQEANLHSQAAHHHDPNWSYPQYVDRYGNVFPQRHQ